MTDPSEAILTAFYNLLEGNLKYPATTGDVWHVFMGMPQQGVGRCVDLSTLDMFDDDGNDTLDCVLTMEVVDGTPYAGGFKTAPVNSIGSQIVALVAKKDFTITGYTFTVLPFLEGNELFKDIISQNNLNLITPRKVMNFRFSCKGN